MFRIPWVFSERRSTMNCTCTLRIAVAFVVILLQSLSSWAGSTREEARKFDAKCRTQYLAGKFDEALANCTKAQQLWGFGDTETPNSDMLGTLFAKKGDMKRAYQYWRMAGDNGTMAGIPDPEARLAAQNLAGEVKRFSDPDRVDPYARGIAAADGLEIILRQSGFKADADEVARQGQALRGKYKSEHTGPGLSSWLSALAMGAPVPRQAPTQVPAASQGIPSSPAAAKPSNDTEYVPTTPACARQDLENDTLFITNVCNSKVTMFYTSAGDVWGGAPLAIGERHRTAWSGEAVRRVGGITVYTCPGDTTPVDMSGNAIMGHYKGDYRCRR